MSKSLLILLVKFLKVVSNSKFIRNSDINLHFESSLGFGPTGPASPTMDHLPRSARDSLAYSPKDAFSSGLCIPAVMPSLSHVVAMRAPPVNSFLSPTRATEPGCTVIGFRPIWPPRATQLQGLRCRPGLLHPCLDSPV
jgi:hypothetical protein